MNVPTGGVRLTPKKKKGVRCEHRRDNTHAISEGGHQKALAEQRAGEEERGKESLMSRVYRKGSEDCFPV